MDDIVQELRDFEQSMADFLHATRLNGCPECGVTSDLASDAADEIEQLRRECKAHAEATDIARREILRVSKERDEAKAEVTRLQNEQWDTTAVADCHHCPCFEGEHYTCRLDGHDCQGIITDCPLRKGPVMLRLVLPREEEKTNEQHR